MKNILIIILLSAFTLITGHGCFAQNTDVQNTTQFDVIRNETAPGGNTKGRIADAYEALNDSKKSVLGDGTASGTNTYAVTGVNLSTVATGRELSITFTNENTSTTNSLTINGGSPIAIKDNAGNDLSVGDLKAGGKYDLKYNGTHLRVTNIGGSGGGSFTLTDGNATTANATSVDIGGELTENTLINGNGNNFEIGQSGDRLFTFKVYASDVSTISSTSGVTISASPSTLALGASSGAQLSAGSNQLLIHATSGSTFTGPVDLGGTATGGVTGNAGTATANQNARTIGTITGDATSAGSSFNGTANNTNALTLATVNSNVGSFGSSTSIPSFTVNAKGLITAASGNAVIAPAGTLTGTTLNSTVVSSSLTSVGALASGSLTSGFTAVNVAQGGTGNASLTAYAPLFGGTTSTGAIQSGTVGTAGQVLTSNGAGALPTFQAAGGTFANKYVTHNIQTGNYTLVLADADTKSIIMRSVSPQNLTVPTHASVAFPEGTTIIITPDSTNTVTVVPASGVIIESSSGLLTSNCKDCPMVLENKNGGDVWFLRNGSPPLGAALTKADDTNVTLTLGGAPTISLLSATSITAGWTGTLGVSRGGTGADNTTTTYTATLTNTANISSSTAIQAGYFRIGSTATVFGQVTIDPTTTLTLTTLGMTIPIASNFTTANQAGGTVGSDVVGNAGRVLSDATNDRVTLQFTATDVTSQTYGFSFSYQIL